MRRISKIFMAITIALGLTVASSSCFADFYYNRLKVIFTNKTSCDVTFKAEEPNQGKFINVNSTGDKISYADVKGDIPSGTFEKAEYATMHTQSKTRGPDTWVNLTFSGSGACGDYSARVHTSIHYCWDTSVPSCQVSYTKNGNPAGNSVCSVKSAKDNARTDYDRFATATVSIQLPPPS